MKGFEIRINDQEPVFAAVDCVLSVTFGMGYDEEDNYFLVEGLDSRSYHIRWIDKKLEIGDKVKIQVAEIDHVSPFLKKYPSDRENLKEEYYKLKKQLEENGLI